MEEFTTADLIAELKEHYYQDRRPGGVTANEWAEVQDITESTARGQLNKLAKGGILTKEKARAEGRIKWVYYKAKPEAPA